MLPQHPPPQCANNTSTGGGGGGIHFSFQRTSSPLWKLQRKGGGGGGRSEACPRRPHASLMSNSKVFWRRGRMGRGKEEEDEDPIFSFFFFAERKGGFLEGKGGQLTKSRARFVRVCFHRSYHRATCTRRKSDLVFVA